MIAAALEQHRSVDATYDLVGPKRLTVRDVVRTTAEGTGLVPLLLVAALGAGAFWGALVVKTRSAVPALVSHALWLAVLFWFPCVRS